MKKLRLPIRMKILLSLLLLVTGVVSVITITMANLFHDDKEAYVNDLVSMVAISTAQECDSLIRGYRERLQVYARLIADEELSHGDKSRLLGSFFDDFPELVAIEVDDGTNSLGRAYNTAILDGAGVSKAQLHADGETHAVAPEQIRESGILLRNSTLVPDLPSLTLTVALNPLDAESALVVSAVIRSDSLLRLAARAQAFEVFLADSTGALLAHRDLGAVARHAKANLRPEVTGGDQRYSAGRTLRYEKDGVEMIGGFSRTESGGVVAGVEIPSSVAYLATRDLLDQLLVVALVLLSLAALGALFWARRITRPVERLSDATRQIAKGRFDVQIDVETRDEIGDLSQSFNQMATELHDREEALSAAQNQLVQSEKMAAFGQLGAGIAHEVKNPLAGILGCAQLALRKTAPDQPQHKSLLLIEKETKRCKTIIDNLLKFARQEKAEQQPIRIETVVEDATSIVNHQLEMNKISLERDLASDLPAVKGNANQLQQVLMNLLINAQQAMEGDPGTVRVSTRVTEDRHVEIRISDTGPGIPPEVKDKLFEPFFTTKPGGKGTGLGLSVSYGIIEDHGGNIRTGDASDGGAEFLITLPILGDPAEPGERV